MDLDLMGPPRPGWWDVGNVANEKQSHTVLTSIDVDQGDTPDRMAPRPLVGYERQLVGQRSAPSR